MALVHSPRIVTDNLVLCVDAANTKSYPGSGTTWYDLSGNGNHWTIEGTVSHGNDTVATSTKVFSMTASGDSNRIVSPATGRNGNDYTIMCATRYTSTTASTQERILSGNDYDPNWLLGHWDGNISVHFAGGWIGSSGGNAPIPGATDWAIYTCSRDHSADDQDYWVNGTKAINDNSSGSNGPDILIVGGGGDSSEYSNCACGFVIVYDKVLTDSEIKQNFDALKGRFGL